MKKYLILLGSLVTIFIIYLILSFFSSSRRLDENISPSPTISPIDYPLPSGIKPEKDGKIIINNRRVNNFFKFSKKINDSGDVEITPNKNYSIQYFPQFDSFLISINSSPFDDIRVQAENDFLVKLGASKEIACELDVSVSTPANINPERAGTQYPLSFCYLD